jgi:hypothetical protein
MYQLIKFTCLFLLCFSGQFNYLFSQSKHALVIAIGDYPQIAAREKNWNDLSSKNDYDIVLDMLKKQKFESKNITSLIDEKATVENINSAFDQLFNLLIEGDIVYFHFSGHGQQIADADGKKFKKSKYLIVDEADGWDEALVTYNAPLSFEEGYEYQDHYVDDQLNYQLTRIRKKIGATGQVIVVLDACHSGTGTRGGEEEIVVRGTSTKCAPSNYEPTSVEKDKSEAFDADLDFGNSPNLGKLTAFFGCKAEQVNREYIDPQTKKQYGSLSYFLVKGMNDLGDSKSSYLNLYSKINEKMIIKFQGQQNPEIESDEMNQLIFRGQMVVQEPFFNVKKLNFDELTIDGGSLNGICLGDTIGIFENSAASKNDGQPKFKGVVTNVSAYNATAKLTVSYGKSEPSLLQFRVFTLFSSADGIELNVKCKIKNKKIQKSVEENLSKIKNIKLVTDYSYSYVIIDSIYNGKNCLQILVGKTMLPLRNMSPISIETSSNYDSLTLLLKEAMKADLFRKMELNDPLIKFEYKIMCLDDAVCDSTNNNSGSLSYVENSGFKLIITNTGSKAFYFNIIDIEPSNKFTWASEEGEWRNKQIIKGESDEIIFNIFPPFGMEQFKLIATSKQVDFSPLERIGSSLAANSRGGEGNPLLDYVSEAVNGTRGGDSSPSQSSATIKTMTFEITEQK